jgi:asparagine synthase (glutamine-hydrolysing)
MPPDLGLDTALRLSVERQNLPLYLRIEDRNSMAHSVEARLPFMDYRLLSLLFSLPPEWKMRGPWSKYILREAMAKRIPDSIKNRTDKMGFALPWGKWIATVLRDPIQDALRSRDARERGIYNLEVIQKDLDLHRDGQTDVTWRIFCVFQYELWSRMDRPAAPPAPIFSRAYPNSQIA